jgi:hypothetical protein
MTTESAPTPMMACGHAANAVMGDKPVCVICYGITEGADVVVSAPDLEGRTAKCTTCGATEASSTSLPFFRHYPEAEFDSYYSGCRGWD